MVDFKAEKIWRNGKLVAWEDATVHVMAHALHYGTSWFEGIRCYKTPRGPEVFRLTEHVDRLFNSCKIYRTEIPFTPDEINQAILETIRVNKLDECYIRPLVFRGHGTIGVNPLRSPLEMIIIAAPWGRYLGEEAIENGVDVCTASWMRAAPNTLPTMAKVGGNYISSALISTDAASKGFKEGIALDVHGYVSEGSGENVFLVQDGKIYTPSISSSILPGITRDSVITMAGEFGYTVIEDFIPKEMLYIADEVFFTGTAAEVTPVRSVDNIVVGSGRRGPVTTRLQKAYFDYVQGRVEDRYDWLTSVLQTEQVEKA